MLIYNPAFDIQHAIFRMLRLLTEAPERPLELERVRILDFLLLFPEQVEAIRFPEEIKRQRSLFVRRYNPYRSLENPRRVLLQMEQIQIAALHCLAAYGLIVKEKLEKNIVERTNRALPPALAEAIKMRNQESKVLVDLLSMEFSRLPFFGDNGFKDRSRLLDTRYDPT